MRFIEVSSLDDKYLINTASIVSVAGNLRERGTRIRMANGDSVWSSEGYDAVVAKIMKAEPEIVRCKDCIHVGDPWECPMCHFEHDEERGDYVVSNVSIDGFCHRGERDTDEEESM